MAYANTRRNYDVRIAHVKNTNNTEKITITFGEGIVRKLGAAYLSIRRVDDKLVFIPHQVKGQYNGIVKVTTDPDRAQFGRVEDIVVLLDFLGEFPIKKNEQNMYYIELGDKSGFTEVHANKGGRAVAETPKPLATPKPIKASVLIDALEAALDECRAEWQKLEVQRKRLDEEMKALMDKMNKINEEAQAYKAALKIAKGE